MRLPRGLVPGVFVARRNRFAADVTVDGQPAVAHVPNTGRMRELLVMGAPVLLRDAAETSGRRTRYDLLLVRAAGRWVGVDSRMPPALVVEAWRRGIIAPLGAYERVQREVQLGSSRVDLLFQGPKGDCYVEAKSVNLVEAGVALFPDAPTERGARHLGELTRRAAQGYAAAAVFVIQRDDAEALAPYTDADPAFARALYEAADQGVQMCAITCTVTRDRITPAQTVPVLLQWPLPTVTP